MTMEEFNWDVGKRIKAIRLERGLTLAELGKAVGLNGANIFIIETGERPMKIWRLHEIAQALGVEDWQIIHPGWEAYCLKGDT